MKIDKPHKTARSLEGKSSNDSLGQMFVIQKHTASHLHYDFRLEMEDPETRERVLISWAVPKNLPTIPEEKHLAIRVENRNPEYINFEGEVPEGSYGAGKVEIWDKGKWGLMRGDLSSGRLSFNLFGEKLKGRYQMIMIKDFGKKEDKEDDSRKSRNWLIWKREAGIFF